MGLLLCLLSVSGNYVLASEQSWQTLLNDGTAALQANDTRYAIYKLHSAWLLVSDQNLDSEAHRKIAEAIAATYSKAGSRQRITEQSMRELDRLIHLRAANKIVGEFDCQLNADGTLAFYAHEQLYAPVAGFCATGSQQQSEIERQRIEQSAKEQLQHQKDLMAKMPLVFAPGSKKYADLLSLCQPITTGQRKEINFDLNPFLPKEFEVAELF